MGRCCGATAVWTTIIAQRCCNTAFQIASKHSEARLPPSCAEPFHGSRSAITYWSCRADAASVANSCSRWRSEANQCNGPYRCPNPIFSKFLLRFSVILMTAIPNPHPATDPSFQIFLTPNRCFCAQVSLWG